VATFDLGFEEELLAQCLKDVEFTKTAFRLVEAHHFSSPIHAWVWKVIAETWKNFAERPSVKVFSARAERDWPSEAERTVGLELVVKLFRLKPESPRASLAELQRFVRFVGLQVAMEGAVKALEKDNIDKAFEVVRKAILRDLRPKSYKESKWIEEFEQRQRDRKHRAEHPDEYVSIPTGLKRLDDVVSGLQAGEVGLVVGTTGRGKSIFLNHLGYQAILHGYGVVHFSLEMPVRQVAARYDSRFTMLAHKKFKAFDFTGEELRMIEARLTKMREKLSGKLRIVSMPLRRCDIHAVKNTVEEVRGEMKVDLVIVDSGDHMQSVVRYDAKRLEQAEVYWDLKTLAEEDALAVWSSTQAGREWENRVAGSEAVSESYDKARIADMILTLNQPSRKSRSTRVGEEEELAASGEAKKGVLELFLAKYRDGESKVRIPLDPDFSRMYIKEAEGAPDSEKAEPV